MTIPAKRSRSSRKGFSRWGIVLAVTAGGRFLLGVVFDEVQHSFDLSHSTLGLIVSLNVLVVGLFQPVVGWLVGRVAARLVAALGLAFISLGMAITSQAHSLPMLVLG